jgi:hypothetical protein
MLPAGLTVQRGGGEIVTATPDDRVGIDADDRVGIDALTIGWGSTALTIGVIDVPIRS